MNCSAAVRHNNACFGCLDLIYVTCQVCRFVSCGEWKRIDHRSTHICL